MIDRTGASKNTNFFSRRFRSDPKDVLYALALQSMILSIIWPKYIGIPLGAIKVNPFLIWQALVIFAYLFYRHEDILKKLKLDHDHRAGSILVIIFSFICIFEIISIVFGGPYASYYQWLQLFMGIKALFLTGYILNEDYQRLKQSIVWILIAFSFTFFIAIGEFLTKATFSGAIMQYLPMLRNDAIDNMAKVKIRGEELRAASLYPHPIVLSIVSGVTIPLFLAMASSTSRKDQQILYYAGLAIAAFTALFTTGSRTAVFVIAVSFPFYLLVFSYRSLVKRISPAFFFIILALAAGALPAIPYLIQVRSGTTGNEAESSLIRVDQWLTGKPYIEQAPVLGWGMGSDGAYAGARVGNSLTIDDSYLSMLLNNGFLGTILFFALALIVCALLFRLIQKSVSPKLARILSAYFAIVVGVVIGQKGNSISYCFGLIYFVAGAVTALHGPAYDQMFGKIVRRRRIRTRAQSPA